jgi:hypothetical protein
MPSPPIQVFLTTIASQPALRQRQEYMLRILHVKKIPFTSYDLASDEAAKKLWKRKAPADKQQLPGLLIGGTFPGTFDAFEEAVEYDELSTFLRLNESHDPKVEEDRPLLPQMPVGVPGAASPAQMTPEHHKPATFPSSSDSPLKSKHVFDVSTELQGFGLQGVKVTDDDLAALVEELGLGGDEADDLVRGLSGNVTHKEEVKKSNPQVELMAELSAKIKPAQKAKVSEAITRAGVEEPLGHIGTKENETRKEIN